MLPPQKQQVGVPTRHRSQGEGECLPQQPAWHKSRTMARIFCQGHVVRSRACLGGSYLPACISLIGKDHLCATRKHGCYGTWTCLEGIMIVISSFVSPVWLSIPKSIYRESLTLYTSFTPLVREGTKSPLLKAFWTGGGWQVVYRVTVRTPGWSTCIRAAVRPP